MGWDHVKVLEDRIDKLEVCVNFPPSHTDAIFLFDQIKADGGEAIKNFPDVFENVIKYPENNTLFTSIKIKSMFLTAANNANIFHKVHNFLYPNDPIEEFETLKDSLSGLARSKKMIDIYGDELCVALNQDVNFGQKIYEANSSELTSVSASLGPGYEPRNQSKRVNAPTGPGIIVYASANASNYSGYSANGSIYADGSQILSTGSGNVSRSFFVRFSNKDNTYAYASTTDIVMISGSSYFFYIDYSEDN